MENSGVVHMLENNKTDGEFARCILLEKAPLSFFSDVATFHCKEFVSLLGGQEGGGLHTVFHF